MTLIWIALVGLLGWTSYVAQVSTASLAVLLTALMPAVPVTVTTNVPGPVGDAGYTYCTYAANGQPGSPAISFAPGAQTNETLVAHEYLHAFVCLATGTLNDGLVPSGEAVVPDPRDPVDGAWTAWALAHPEVAAQIVCQVVQSEPERFAPGHCP